MNFYDTHPEGQYYRDFGSKSRPAIKDGQNHLAEAMPAPSYARLQRDAAIYETQREASSIRRRLASLLRAAAERLDHNVA